MSNLGPDKDLLGNAVIMHRISSECDESESRRSGILPSSVIPSEHVFRYYSLVAQLVEH